MDSKHNCVCSVFNDCLDHQEGIDRPASLQLQEVYERLQLVPGAHTQSLAAGIVIGRAA